MTRSPIWLIPIALGLFALLSMGLNVLPYLTIAAASTAHETRAAVEDARAGVAG